MPPCIYSDWEKAVSYFEDLLPDIAGIRQVSWIKPSWQQSMVCVCIISMKTLGTCPVTSKMGAVGQHSSTEHNSHCGCPDLALFCLGDAT